MINNLLGWEIKDNAVADLGRRVQDVNVEFCMVSASLDAVVCQGVVNQHHAMELRGQVRELLNKSKKLAPKNAFDKLALTEFRHSLETQKRFLDTFFTEQHVDRDSRKPHPIGLLLDEVFLPNGMYKRKDYPRERGAIVYLEDVYGGIDKSDLTKRERLMWPMVKKLATLGPLDTETLYLAQIPRIRKMLTDFSVQMGWETKSQAKRYETLDIQGRTRLNKERMRVLFGSALEHVVDEVHGRANSGPLATSLNRRVNIDPALETRFYRLVFGGLDGYSYENITRTMELGTRHLLFYYGEGEAGKEEIKAFTADADVTMGHENFHRGQNIFSRGMPVGLKDDDGSYNLTGRTITEGTAVFLENFFIEWMEKNRQKYGYNEKDIEIARLERAEYFASRIPRLLLAIYGRQELTEGNTDYLGADKRLARITGIPMFEEAHFMLPESPQELFYLFHYPFGEFHVERAYQRLEDNETRKFRGNRERAQEFLRVNRPAVVQGMLTGNWGWKTYGDFLNEHYWPEARKQLGD